MSKILVVLSGGQDSVTCLYDAVQKVGAENVYAISFDYGQVHKAELQAAAIVAGMAGLNPYNVEFIRVAGLLQSTSPLLGKHALDRYESFEKMEQQVGSTIEKTFVPMRNTLFLVIAANRAIAWGCDTIVTGICGEDNANYPDCTEDFRDAVEAAFVESLGYNRDEYDHLDLTISAPLMFLSKAETVKLAESLPGCMKALAYSHTSYDGQYPPTDNNHSNLLRAHGFEEAGLPDPLVLRAWKEGKMQLPETANYEEADRYVKEWGL